MNNLDTLISTLFDIDEINANKIQFIKEELSAGRYEIQSDLIASKLLEHVPLLEELETT